MEFTKSQKRNIRELAALAYERELGQELGKLEEQFARWRRGDIDVQTLSDAIHKFHNGPARELYSLYTGDMLELVVGGAIARGVLTPAEVPQDTLPILRRYSERR
ncbi:MAG TPA: hypothetical protein VJ801_11665 [Polyangia bacterium]|jgi:hypothetical protein|nr:hypothetical protein [Polyangia bacterium]